MKTTRIIDGDLNLLRVESGDELAFAVNCNWRMFTSTPRESLQLIMLTGHRNFLHIISKYGDVLYYDRWSGGPFETSDVLTRREES